MARKTKQAGPAPEPQLSSAASRYAALESQRGPVLDRARQAAALTLPYLVPPSGATQSTTLVDPYQSVGGRGVNNLSSKLLMSILPPNSPFIRMEATEEVIAEAEATEKSARTNIATGLAKYDRALKNGIEQAQIRAPFKESLRHLVISGNVLVNILKGGRIRVFGLSSYVVKRDGEGNALEIILKEMVSRLELPESALELIPEGERKGKAVDDNIELYTWIQRTTTGWTAHQELKWGIVPGTAGVYPKDYCPWLPLRWNRIDGEDYGRGHVEEYLGDLSSLESLTESLVAGSAAMARLLLLVKPNGTTKMIDVSSAPNGAVRAGNAEDVTVLQINKAVDLRVTAETAANIETRLSYAFLLNSAVQRAGERVTAEEIRYVASELDSTMGGLYSILAQEFQLPYARIVMRDMERSGSLPKLPKGTTRPVIITGIEALGRGNDLEKLGQLIQALAPLGPEVFSKYLNIGDYIARVATSLGIDKDGLINSEDDVKQAAQQAQQQALMAKIGPQMVTGAAGLVKQGMTNVQNGDPQGGAQDGAGAGASDAGAADPGAGG